MNVLASLFGNYSKRELKRIQPICDRVLMKEDTYKDMTDEELTAQTGAVSYTHLDVYKRQVSSCNRLRPPKRQIFPSCPRDRS